MTTPRSSSWPIVALRALWRLRGEIFSDTLIVGGASSMIYGVSLYQVPAAWIFGGALALAAGVLAARAGTSTS